MKRSNLIKLGDAIDQLFKEEHLTEKMAQFKIKANWKLIVGELIAKSTKQISFNKGTIFISIQSPALRHELSFRKEEVLRHINQFVKIKLVENIVIQ